MITKELVDRINYLSRKQRSEGLTAQEAAEQQEVRQQYLQGIRAQLKDTLSSIKFVDPEELDHHHSETCSCCKKN